VDLAGSKLRGRNMSYMISVLCLLVSLGCARDGRNQDTKHVRLELVGSIVLKESEDQPISDFHCAERRAGNLLVTSHISGHLQLFSIHEGAIKFDYIPKVEQLIDCLSSQIDSKLGDLGVKAGTMADFVEVLQDLEVEATNAEYNPKVQSARFIDDSTIIVGIRARLPVYGIHGRQLWILDCAQELNVATQRVSKNILFDLPRPGDGKVISSMQVVRDSIGFIVTEYDSLHLYTTHRSAMAPMFRRFDATGYRTQYGGCLDASTSLTTAYVGQSNQLIDSRESGYIYASSSTPFINIYDQDLHLLKALDYTDVVMDINPNLIAPTLFEFGVGKATARKSTQSMFQATQLCVTGTGVFAVTIHDWDRSKRGGPFYSFVLFLRSSLNDKLDLAGEIGKPNSPMRPITVISDAFCNDEISIIEQNGTTKDYHLSTYRITDE